MPRLTINVRDFDPFEFTWLYRGLKYKHTGVLSLIAPFMAFLLVLATLVDGTFGRASDFQLWDDLRRMAGARGVPPSSTSFPLMRDVASWFLAFTVVSGALLLHREWQHMSTCLSELAKSEAIQSRSRIRSNVISRILLIDRLVAGVPAHRALSTFVDKVVSSLRRISGWVLVGLVVASLVLAYLLVLGEEHSLFQPLVPHNLSPAERQQWLEGAYRNWWAGTEHVTGHALYLVIAVFAIFVILSFQTVGFVAVYVAIGMYFIVEPGADWLNRDGNYGWTPMSRVYRTVIWATALLGTTLTLVLAFMGIQNYGWVLGLGVLYIIFVPLFLGVPWILFRNVEKIAKENRLREISAIIASRGPDVLSDFEFLGPVVAEITRCRTARIHPLRQQRVISLWTVVTLVVLPVVLAMAQIFFQLQFGSG